MTQSRHPTLVAAPQVSFAELRQQLAELGWQLEAASEAPILPGEPEFAMLVHAQDATVLHYTFNPVLLFRVLQFRGSNAEAQRMQASHRIASIDIAKLRALLESIEIRQVLLGLFAAGELGKIGVVEEVNRLRAHQDERIARTAVRIHGSLLDRLQPDAGQPDQEKTERTERSVRSSEQRKQILRTLLRDSQTSNPNIDQLLFSGLNDADPEVRVTAVFAAAKLGATNLLAALRETNLPKSTSEGAYDRDRLLYERLRQTAIGYLSMGERGGEAGTEDPRIQFRKALSGEIAVRDDTTLLLHALTTPVHLGDKPPRLPDAVEGREGSYVLRRSGLVLRWVAPIPHWLGEESARGLLPNPIRRVTPQSGFFIAETPIDSAAALCTSDPQQRPSTGAAEAEPFLCGYAEAIYLCELLSKLEGLTLELPFADQWEMAARGTDGRRYPWGNSWLPSGSLQPSPWLVRNLVGRVPEWTSDCEKGVEGSHILCGGTTALPCARRHSVNGNSAQQCAVRPVLNCAVNEMNDSHRTSSQGIVNERA